MVHPLQKNISNKPHFLFFSSCKEPDLRSVYEGESLNMNCSIVRGERTDLRWKRGDRHRIGQKHFTDRIGGIYFNQIDQRDAGLYICYADNRYYTSNGFILNVQGTFPEIFIQAYS